ncbi:hypothetical protein AMS62_26985 [Bacillus sp. FJAT-18019]|nr:hypothetical protein AMS62_26985 [Bacillus sp. FJAT-18019]
MLEELEKIVRRSSVHDIYLVGFVDIEDGFAEFCPDLRYYYFELGGQFIEFESIDQYSRLSVKVVDSIRYQFEIDEDMIPCKTSVSQMILTDSMSAKNTVKSIIIYGMEMGIKEQLICDSLQISLNNGQVLFLDPSFYFGINIGGEEQRQFWMENITNHAKPIEKKLEF